MIPRDAAGIYHVQIMEITVSSPRKVLNWIGLFCRLRFIRWQSDKGPYNGVEPHQLHAGSVQLSLSMKTSIEDRRSSEARIIFTDP
jgi:hypothetical protein